MYLNSLTSIPEGFNPTVGGDLYLRSLTSIPEGFNPTVGGYLYLNSLTSIPEGFNPTVGGSLYLRSGSKRIGSVVNRNLFWGKDGKKYAIIDGDFCEILAEKTSKGIRIYSAKKVNKDRFFYIANHGKFYAHGETIKQAITDLSFKIQQDKLAHEPITMDTVVTVEHYRAITGACEVGVKDWMRSNGITAKSITVAELLPLLERTHAYGVERFKALIK